MKKVISLIMVLGLCFSLAGCGGNSGESEKGSASVKLNDYPKVETKSKTVLGELTNSPSISETKTKIEYSSASSNTDNIIALHYNTSNDGELIIKYYIDSAKVQGLTLYMDKDKASKTDDYLALVSAATSISDFNFDDDMYEKLGEVVQSMKATKIKDLTVSMTEIDGKFEFSIFYA